MPKREMFVVHKAQIEDVGKGIARIRLQDMTAMGLETGDIIEIIGSSKTVAKLMPIDGPLQNGRPIQMDGIKRESAGAGLDDFVEIRKTAHHPAKTLLISPFDDSKPLPQDDEVQQLASILAMSPVIVGDKLEVTTFGSGHRHFLVIGTNPQGPIVINPDTLIKVKHSDISGDASGVSYEDIGGLDAELQRIREIVEYPIKYPELFKSLGIDILIGILLIGPAGVGKTLIAKAIANEVKAKFFHLDGPEIMSRFYGESEAKLRQIFDEASANAPSIIFIDEIDAIVPKRADAVGNVEKRVVAQLLVLMDGLVERSNVVVIGATNAPNLMDSAIRRPGRFDREIIINPSNRLGRLEILKIHTRTMPLHHDVNLELLAELTHGFVGSDLASLVKEAGMLALRRILYQMRSRGEDLSKSDQLDLYVENRNFFGLQGHRTQRAKRVFA